MLKVDISDAEKFNIVFPVDQLSAFARIRTANPYTLVDLINTEFIDPDEYTQDVDAGDVGSITHLPDQSAIELAVSDGTDDAYAVLQTKDYLRYQSGKGLYWLTTLAHDDLGRANQEREWGLLDSNDGVFFRLQGTELQLVKRSSTSGGPQEVVYPQSAWNQDCMNGRGRSGKTLNILNGNIYECRRLQWLGVGNVEFYINGYPVHTMQHAGLLTVPYMKSARLPLQWRIVNTGTSAGGSMRYICSHAGIDGGEDPPTRSFGYSMGVAVNCLNAVEKPLFSIRLAANFPTTGSITSRIRAFPTLARFSAESQRGAIRLVWNPTTMTGATWATTVDATSGMEVDTATTAITGGQTIDRPFIPQNQGENFELRSFFGRHKRRMRQGDVLTVMGVGEAAPSSDIRGTLCWDEER